MHYILAISLLIGFLYSVLKLFKQKLTQHKNSASFDAIALFIFLKISVAICFFAFIENSMIHTDKDSSKYLLLLQLLSYTLGDIFILMSELLAIFFFGIGHVCFLNLFMLHQFIEVITHPALATGLIGVPSVVFYFLPSKYIDSLLIVRIMHKLMLIVYMVLLYLVWMMPIFHWYFPGMVLFVVSDLFIVFQWPGAWFAEYMLYIGSLISLYTWYTW